MNATTFTEEIRKLMELESSIVNLNDNKIVVPYEVETTVFYTFLKRLWYEKFDRYAAFPFPVGNYIEADNEFKVFPMKPWGILGVHLLKKSFVQVKPVNELK